MTRQYFQVGEEVILDSKLSPELNGEYTVSEVLTFDEAFQDAIFKGFSGIKKDYRESFYYGLKELSYTAESASGISAESNTCIQSSLRKKHTPGEDFQSLINSLNKDKVAS